MKELSKTTGINIEDLRNNPLSPEELHKLLETSELKSSISTKVVAINNAALVVKQQKKIQELEAVIKKQAERIKQMERTEERQTENGWKSSGWEHNTERTRTW